MKFDLTDTGLKFGNWRSIRVVGVPRKDYGRALGQDAGGSEGRAKKIGGRHRARVATSPQVQNRMVEILRMCTFRISNLDTAIRVITQIIAE